MLKIAICDDESYFREQIKEWTEKALEEQKVSRYQVDTYSSGRELLENEEGISCYHAILLDIEMQEESGMQVAARIRKSDREIPLIFVTSHVEFMQEGYHVRALRYVLKNNQDQLQEAVEAIIQLVAMQEVTRSFEFREGFREIRLNRILYIESVRHTLHFYLTQGEVRTMTGKLDRIEEDLNNEEFIRIHKSYLVNYRHIQMISNYQVVLDENHILPIPRDKYRKVREVYYCLKGGRR
mgnify:FL=1